MYINTPIPPYFSLEYGQFNCVYIGDKWGGLDELSDANDSERELSEANDSERELSDTNDSERKLSPYAIAACQHGLKEIYEIFNSSCLTIGKQLGWEPPQITNEQISHKFTQWISSSNVKDLKVLDLRNLGLQLLPPQISPSFFPAVTKINLSGNQLRKFQNVFKKFHLEELDISGNSILLLNIPDWLSEKQNKENLRLITKR